MAATLVLIFSIIATLVGIGILVFTIIRAKRSIKETSKLQKAGLAMVAILVVVAVTINFAVYNFNNVIDIYFSTLSTSESEELQQARENSKSVTEEIESEAIVLLKNSGNKLPLQTTNVNVFGYGALSPIYGGTGSGGSDESGNINIYSGISNAGFSLNQELINFYRSHEVPLESINIHALTGGDYNFHEPNLSEFSSDLIKNAQNFSDTALVVFSRNAGEGADLPMDMEEYTGGTAGKHYLELADNEQAMLEMVLSNFGTVIIIINSSNAMELGFLEDARVSAAIWVGAPGSTGTNAIGKVLSGEVNPSGRLVDTYTYDVTNNPAFFNSGTFYYKDAKNNYTTNIYTTIFGLELPHYAYLDYQENIYVGYKYYETRWVDNKTGEVDESAYREAVQFPFGYGSSYTTFKQSITDFERTNDTVKIAVTVENTGSVAGKDVVQIYYTPPYYPGAVEKAHVNLIDFAKTDLLQPGESQTISLEFSLDEMASYDYLTEKAYILDKGTYDIKLMKNAHELIDSRSFDLDSKVVYNESGAGSRPSDEVIATNLFDEASFGNNIINISRADWEGTTPMSRPAEKKATDEMIAVFEDRSVYNEEADPIVLKNHGLSIEDMVGLDYGDPLWDQLLEQVTVDEMTQLISYGGYITSEIKSVGKLRTNDFDGPAGVNNFITGATGTQFTSETTIAATWNIPLMERMAECLATEAIHMDISGIYAPAINIHRTAFGGRNFEYFSEDAFLSGQMAAAFSRGAMNKGTYVYMKHFVLTEQEDSRLGFSVWCSEQALREIYLKAFEIAVKDGNTTAVMASDTRIGLTLCTESSELLNDVLRGEWGFRGFVITDYVVDTYKTADISIRNGCEMMLTTTGMLVTEQSTGTNYGQQVMRAATKNILYTYINSNAHQISKPVTPYWTLLVIGADIILFGLAILIVFKSTKPKNKSVKVVKDL